MAVEILKNSLSAWQRWTRQQWGEIQWWRRPVVSTASYPPCPPCPPLPLPKVLSRLQLSSSSTISRGLVVWNHQLKLCIVPMLSTSSDTRVTSKKLNSCRKIVKVLSTINGLKDSFHVAITTFLPILIYLLIWEKLYKFSIIYRVLPAASLLKRMTIIRCAAIAYSWTEAKIFNMDQVTTCHGIFQALEISRSWKIPWEVACSTHGNFQVLEISMG